MPLFFLPGAVPQDNVLSITGEDARHIALSLRMATGDGITVSDGVGALYDCTLTNITPDSVKAAVLAVRTPDCEPPYALTLYQAVPKSDKLETIVQKATELGATRIVPFLSAFCVKRPHEDKWEKQSTRLARIAEEAAKQCKRAVIPEIGPLLDFGAMIEDARRAALPLFCYEGENTVPLPASLPDSRPHSIAVIVGCEGGFSTEEAARIMASGITAVGLGRRILRCETAPLFALASLEFRYEI